MPPASQKAEALVSAVLRGWVPDTSVRSYREFAKSIKLSGGPLAGHYYDPATDPAQDYLCAQFDSGNWDHFFVCAPPQVGGKTQLCVLVPALRDAIECRASVGYGLPTIEDLNRAWTTKVRKSIIGGGYFDYLPKQGPGSKGGRGAAVVFHDPEDGNDLGEIVFMAGGSYAITVKTVIIDEVDQMRKRDGTPNWKAIDHMFHRADSYGAGAFRVATGTVEDDNKSIILVLVGERGTGTRMWPRCPTCRVHIPFDWDLLIYDATDEVSARETARIACAHCGAHLDEDERQIAIRDSLFCHRGQTVESGVVVGNPPRTKKLGLLWTALESSLSNLGHIAADHRDATIALRDRADHSKMRDHFRYQRCQTYRADIVEESGDSEVMTAQYLAFRSKTSGFSPYYEDRDPETHSRHIAEVIPEHVEHAVIACDVQGDRIYWGVIGFAGASTYDLGYGYEHLPKRADQRLIQFADGDTVSILARIDADVCSIFGSLPFLDRVVDVGYNAVEIERFLKPNRSRWTAVRGAKHIPKASNSIKVRCENLLAFDGAWRPGLGCWILEDEPAMVAIHARYLIAPGAPGAAYLGAGLVSSDAYVRHLCAFQWVAGKFKKVSGREDWADCRKYATHVGLCRLGHYDQRKKKPRRQYGVVTRPTEEY